MDWYSNMTMTYQAPSACIPFTTSTSTPLTADQMNNAVNDTNSIVYAIARNTVRWLQYSCDHRFHADVWIC